jgi:hypothetical protein
MKALIILCTRRVQLAGMLFVLAVGMALAPPSFSAELSVEGGCTLPDAIASANSDTAIGGCPAGESGADTIHLTSDVVLTAIADIGDILFSNVGPAGLPRIETSIVIEGNGFTLSRDPAAPDFRLLMVFGGFFGSGDLVIRDLTLRGGRAVLPTPDFTEAADDGGALLNLAGRTRLERVGFRG